MSEAKWTWILRDRSLRDAGGTLSARKKTLRGRRASSEGPISSLALSFLDLSRRANTTDGQMKTGIFFFVSALLALSIGYAAAQAPEQRMVRDDPVEPIIEVVGEVEQKLKEEKKDNLRARRVLQERMIRDDPVEPIPQVVEEVEQKLKEEKKDNLRARRVLQERMIRDDPVEPIPQVVEEVEQKLKEEKKVNP